MRARFEKLVNGEGKKILEGAKMVQSKLQSALKNQDWIEDARKYAEQQGKEVRKLLAGDVSKVKKFMEKERKELARFQKEIPAEVHKLKKFVTSQRKELEKLLKNLRRATATGRTKPRKKTTSGAKKRSPGA